MIGDIELSFIFSFFLFLIGWIKIIRELRRIYWKQS